MVVQNVVFRWRICVAFLSCCFTILTGARAETMSEGETRTITFEITTAAPLQAGEQVFVTGEPAELGSWQPDGLPLSRLNDSLWSASVTLPGANGFEFKITRGSWDAEQVDQEGNRPGNSVVKPGHDEVVRVHVQNWSDHPAGPRPQIEGDYRIHDSIQSKYLHHDRKVIVWLPPSYAKEPERRFPVLYMHDGQQVFDPQTSTWGQDWEIDEWCTKLIAKGRIQEIIVVGIYNSPDRSSEYEPSKSGPEYASFLVEELKPFIDAEYRTQPGREHTAVAGSSMGGAISMYLAWSRPDVFFGAACLSPAFDYKESRHCLDMVSATEKAPDLKIYLYCGKADGLEQVLLPGVVEMQKLLEDHGFSPGENLLIVEDPYAEHNEGAWAKHSDEWLQFLFGK